MASRDTHLIKITGTAKEACPIFSLSYFFNKYPIPFGIVFIGCGLIMAFLGFKIFRVVLFLMATFIVAFILFTVIYQLSASTISMSNSWVIWLILAASLLIGLIAGFLAAKFPRFCFLIAGGTLGGLAGFLIYTAFLTSVQGAVLLLVHELVANVRSYCCWRYYWSYLRLLL